MRVAALAQPHAAAAKALVASAFCCIDTRNMEQRRNLHRKRAIVVYLGLECAYGATWQDQGMSGVQVFNIPQATEGANRLEYACLLKSTCRRPSTTADQRGPDLGSPLLLQFLHSMLLIIDNVGCKRHGPRHANVSQGDNECFSFFRRSDMAHDATFVASV
jgi:hypothetical protein